MSIIPADGTALVLGAEANGLQSQFSKPWHERRKVVTSFCDRLVGDLDTLLDASQALCFSMDSGLPGRSGQGYEREKRLPRAVRSA